MKTEAITFFAHKGVKYWCTCGMMKAIWGTTTNSTSATTYSRRIHFFLLSEVKRGISNPGRAIMDERAKNLVCVVVAKSGMNNTRSYVLMHT